VNPAVPAQSVPAFIAYAKTNPGKINMGSAGSGTPQQTIGEMFKMMTLLRRRDHQILRPRRYFAKLANCSCRYYSPRACAKTCRLPALLTWR
jgi:hypothetical protein